MAVAQRYDRQARISGWDQNALGNATLTIVGRSTLSDYLAIAGSALGVGKIRVIETPYDGALNQGYMLRLSDKKTYEERLEDIVGKVGNSELQYTRAHMKSRAEDWFLEGSTFVADATGRNESRALSLNYSITNRNGIELVNLHDKGFSFINAEENPLVLYDCKWNSSDVISSLVAAGALLEEAKRSIFNKPAARDSVNYEFQEKPGFREDYSKIHALVIGAGALGNFVAPGLAVLGFKSVDIMDFDSIEETNLNRQIMFFDAVGGYKAEVLAERSRRIAGTGAKFKPMIDRFGDKTDVKKYNIIFDCVDDFGVRSVISKKCTDAKVPLISGGTSFSAGQAVAYMPGKTSCPSHVLDLEKIAEIRRTERQRQATGCLYQPDASVIMTNEVTAGMMLNSARQIIYPNIFDLPVNGQYRYEASGRVRFGKINMSDRCGD